MENNDTIRTKSNNLFAYAHKKEGKYGTFHKISVGTFYGEKDEKPTFITSFNASKIDDAITALTKMKEDMKITQ